MSRTIFEVHSNLFDDNDWGGEPCVGDEIEHDGKRYRIVSSVSQGYVWEDVERYDVVLAELPEEVREGRFSVSTTRQVVFAKGNLLFGRSLDGSGLWKSSKEEWFFSKQQYGPCPYGCKALFRKDEEDWKTHLGDAGQWRILSAEEWDYLSHVHTSSEATVNGIHGLILLPNDFEVAKPEQFHRPPTLKPNAKDWTTNSFNLREWAAMEFGGAVFLPAIGMGYRGFVMYEQEWGIYLSASPEGAVAFFFSEKGIDANWSVEADIGAAIRLVKDVGI